MHRFSLVLFFTKQAGNDGFYDVSVTLNACRVLVSFDVFGMDYFLRVGGAPKRSNGRFVVGDVKKRQTLCITVFVTGAQEISLATMS